MKYLQVWEKIFNSDYKDSCKNILHIVELLLITTITNAKLEPMFSRMNHVKTDWQNHLSLERLEHNLCIGEEGPTSKDFNPKASISKWYSQKVRRIDKYAKPHKYPEKWRNLEQFSISVNIVTYCLSDFETDSDKEQ